MCGVGGRGDGSQYRQNTTLFTGAHKVRRMADSASYKQHAPILTLLTYVLFHRHPKTGSKDSFSSQKP